MEIAGIHIPFTKFVQKQRCLIWKENGDVDDIELPIEKKGFLVDEDKQEAFYLLHDLLLPMDGSDDEYLLISERDGIPWDPFKVLSEAKLKKLIKLNLLAKENYNRAIADISKDSHKNLVAQTLRLVILIFAVLIALIILLMVTGHLPAFW